MITLIDSRATSTTLVIRLQTPRRLNRLEWRLADSTNRFRRVPHA